MAGANKPDGKNRDARVAFTRRDADRIARVVRTVEQGDRKGTPLSFGSGPRQMPQDVFRMATFTGDSSGGWAKGSTTTVTFNDPPWNGQTATAINHFCSIGGGAVGVSRTITNVWHLVSWEMESVCGTKIEDITINLNTANCAITKTLHTTTVQYLTLSFPYVTCSGQD